MPETGTIVIKFVEGSKKVPGPKPITDKIDESGSKDDSVLETAILSALLKRTARQIKGLVLNEAKYQIDLHFKLTDNYLGAQNLNIALGVVNKVASFGLSIYSGAKLGFSAGGGAAGAVVGAVFAAGVSGLSLVQQISHNYEQEYIRINQMNANLQFNRQRAGYSLTSGSIGENR